MRHSILTVSLTTALAIWCTGCPSQSTPTPATPAATPATPTAALKAIDPATAGGIKGRVEWSDPGVPTRAPVNMGADAKCSAMHATPVLDETVIVNDNGTLRNVYVWVKTGLESFQVASGTGTVTIDQQGCAYHPHVLALQMGQTLQVKNSDAVLHNIHSLAELCAAFNFSQSKQGDIKDVTENLTDAEFFKVKCDVHPWMGAWIGVSPHPYFAVTGEDGAFQLVGLPPGRFTVEARHEELGSKTAEVTVPEKGTAETSFSFSESDG